MYSSPQQVPAAAQGVVRAARRRDHCPAYQRPRVRELPLRLERVEVDDFGGLLASRPASGGRSINHQKGAHS